MRGKNRAQFKSESSAYINENYSDIYKRCVFISHKSEDKTAAESIANYIMNMGVDVYLDTNDDKLQEATKNNDANKIVEYIELGLSKSTNLLVVISDKTKTSWWVPYEIGYVKKCGIPIASILLKDVSDFPDYLKIEKRIHGEEELKSYVIDLSGTGNYSIFYESAGKSDVLNYIKK